MNKVLIVEGKATIRHALQQSLSLHCEVCVLREATNSDDALKLIREWHPDVVFIDIKIPGRMDGLAVCREVKNAPEISGTLIVMLSDISELALLKTGEIAGADACITKPFLPSQISDIVTDLIGKRVAETVN